MATATQAAKSGNIDQLARVLTDKKFPVQVRAHTFHQALLSTDADAQQAVIAAVLERLTADPSGEAAELKALYEQALLELQSGPPRAATFVSRSDDSLTSIAPRVRVMTHDGSLRYPMVPEGMGVTIESLEPGDTVFTDCANAVVLGFSKRPAETGPEATFLRHLPGTSTVEAEVNEQRVVLFASAALLRSVEAGEIKRGQRLVCCARREFAYFAMPAESDHKHRFIERCKLPQVDVERDIGSPHWVLDWMVRRTRLLLFKPDALAQFDLRPRLSVLMTGPSGTGKTLTIRAFLTQFDRMLAERTGRDDIGSRVIRFKLAEMLSEWLGRSDKNIDGLFTAVQEVASEPVTTAGGERLLLPVVLVMEEAEGIARRRGEFDSGIYDRIVGTMLQRLDDPTDDLGRLPLVLITTTNRPELFDAAMWRRLAGTRAHFRRLDQKGFAAVLDKKLKPHYPYANGRVKAKAREHVLANVVEGLFGKGAEPVAELAFRDGRKQHVYRRDFLTGAVVEQGVSNAIDQAVLAAEAGEEWGGVLTAPVMNECLSNVIDGLAENLTPQNAQDYVDLPENAQVAQVKVL